MGQRNKKQRKWIVISEKKKKKKSICLSKCIDSQETYNFTISLRSGYDWNMKPEETNIENNLLSAVYAENVTDTGAKNADITMGDYFAIL